MPWVPITRASTKETQAELERILGLSRDTFLASSLALQGGGSFADPSVNPAARKRLLADALGLARWDRFHDQAKQDRKDRQQALVALAPLIAADRETVAGKAALVEEAQALAASTAIDEQRLANAQADLEAATEQYHAARALTERVAAARAQVDAAETEKRRLDGIAAIATLARDALGPLEDRARELHPVLEELPAYEAEERRLRDEVAEHRRRVAEHIAAVTAREAVRAKVNDLVRRAADTRGQAADLQDKATDVLEHVGDAECDRCGQTLGQEAAQRAALSFQQDARQLLEQANALDNESQSIEVPDIVDPPVGDPPVEALDAVAARVLKGRQAQVELAGLMERIRGERAKIAQAETVEYVADLADAEARLAAAEADLVEARAACPDRQQLAQIQQAGLTARADAAETQQRLDTARGDLARLDERLGRVNEAETRLAASEARSNELQAEVDELTMLERAYSRDGIPALVLENAAVPFIEAEASRILAELGTGFRVELRTQAELKSGDGVRDTLDVIVVTEDGLEQPYALCSGGEETRIGLALRIALAGLLAHRRGAESRLLAIDEPSFLDAAGMNRLVEILRGLEGTFSKLILVSHVSELRDAFDQAIVVQKDGTRARVLAGDREAVAA